MNISVSDQVFAPAGWDSLVETLSVMALSIASSAESAVLALILDQEVLVPPLACSGA